MKKIILTLLLAYSVHTALGQIPLQTVSRGTWVVESNLKTPKGQVIKFYNTNLELIYQESVTNRKVRYEKERIRRALDKTLQLALNNEERMKAGTFTMVLRSGKLPNSKPVN